MAYGGSNGGTVNTNEATGDLWLVDSGCSNHMTGTRELFKELDETKKSTMKLGDDNEMHMEERGTVAITTIENKIRIFNNNQYVPKPVTY